MSIWFIKHVLLLLLVILLLFSLLDEDDKLVHHCFCNTIWVVRFLYNAARVEKCPCHNSRIKNWLNPLHPLHGTHLIQDIIWSLLHELNKMWCGSLESFKWRSCGSAFRVLDYWSERSPNPNKATTLRKATMPCFVALDKSVCKINKYKCKQRSVGPQSWGCPGATFLIIVFPVDLSWHFLNIPDFDCLWEPGFSLKLKQKNDIPLSLKGIYLVMYCVNSESTLTQKC